MKLHRAAALVVLAAAALAGCYRSEVQVVDEAALVRAPNLDDGVYCEAERTAEGGVALLDDCRVYTWQGNRFAPRQGRVGLTEPRNVYLETRPDQDDWRVEMRVADLGGGVFVSEVDEGDGEDWRYSLLAFVPASGGFAVIGDVRRDGLGDHPAAHPDVAVDAEDNGWAGQFVAGEPAAIRALMAAAVRDDLVALTDADADQEAVTLFVRAENGDDSSDHAARFARVEKAVGGAIGRALAGD